MQRRKLNQEMLNYLSKVENNVHCKALNQQEAVLAEFVEDAADMGNLPCLFKFVE